MTDKYLFVYGTLRSGYDNRWARKLRGESHLFGQARVRGRLTRLGRHRALIPGRERWVTGELYRLVRGYGTLRVLDRYEGSDYQRVVLNVRAGVARWIAAFVYIPAYSARSATIGSILDARRAGR